MTTELNLDVPKINDIQVQWSDAQLLYPLYCSLARECTIDAPACHELEKGIGTASKESLLSGWQWLVTMDERIGVHQLRHFLQTTTTVADDAALRALLRHHLRKPERGESDRNKTDFLLVQLFSLCAPAHLADREFDLECVARTLEPVLGTFDLAVPEWLTPLEELVQRAQSCRTLKELFTSRIIEQGRKLKETCGDNYFSPLAMAAFARSGFLVRRVFFRLMHQDLNAILDGLRELETRGIENLDCRKAQFSAHEPIARLRMICQSWKVMFHAEYSSGQPLCLLVDLRTVVDTALAKTLSKAKSSPKPGQSLADTEPGDTEKSRAAKAAAGAAEPSEFQVFGSPATTDDDGTNRGQ